QRLCIHAEHRWGRARYALIYIASALGGILCSAIVAADRVTVAGSAGTVGVIFALLLQLFFTQDNRDPLRQFLFLLIAMFSLAILLLGLSVVVDFSCHVGAAFVGSLLAIALWGAEHPLLST